MLIEHGHEIFRHNFDFWGLKRLKCIILVHKIKEAFLAVEFSFLRFRQNKKNRQRHLIRKSISDNFVLTL